MRTTIGMLACALAGCGSVGAMGSPGTSNPDATIAADGSGTADGAPLTSGLLAHYRGNGIDLTGSGADMVPHNVALVVDRFGSAGKADGYSAPSMSFLELVNDVVLPVGAAACSISAWISTIATTADVGGIVNWGSANTTGARFGLLNSHGKAYFVGEARDLVGKAVVNDGGWHHLAVTFDGLSVVMYVDAVVDASSSLALATTGQSLEIGRSTMDKAVQEWFTGSIDDVRIYDRALTGPEVSLLFQEPAH